MRWFKVAAIVVVLACKAAFYQRQVPRKQPESQIRRPTCSQPLPPQQAPDVDEELARLKREMRN